jgi:hypothetical protein
MGTLTAWALSMADALHLEHHGVFECNGMAIVPCCGVCDVPRVLHIVDHFKAHTHRHVAHGALHYIHHPTWTKTTPSIILTTDQSGYGTDEAWLLCFPLSCHLHMQGALVSDRVGVARKDVRVDDRARATGR